LAAFSYTLTLLIINTKPDHGRVESQEKKGDAAPHPPKKMQWAELPRTKNISPKNTKEVKQFAGIAVKVVLETLNFCQVRPCRIRAIVATKG